ncbi:MAG: glycosyltransferase [Candidatus Moraniibacteriota bacterium]
MINGKMRIAMVAPPFGDTGGPEIVTQNLTDALLTLGVKVTLFAPADWKTQARHVVSLEKSIWNMKNLQALSSKEFRQLKISSQEKVLAFQKEFDIIHLHSQRYALGVCEKAKIPCVISFHNRVSEEVFGVIEKSELHTVALSQSQRGRLAVSAVIYNGVPMEKIQFSFEKGRYLIFVGRLTDQKGIDTAIKIAVEAKQKLLIFGRIGNTQERKDFFNEKIKPFLDDKNIVYKGEVSHSEIYEYLRNASAFLFPIRRPEVCPMVVAEALACGTPIIGTTIGPLPELLNNKKVAFLSDDFDQLVEAVKNTNLFDRKACRKYAQENFDSMVMAKKYLKLYEDILGNSKK